MKDRPMRAGGRASSLSQRLRQALTARRASEVTVEKSPTERRAGRAAELAETVRATSAASALLDEVTAERDRLRKERLRLQQELGAQHGKRVMPRLKVEKTNGDPSFVAGQRMMQRVHRLATEPASGLDGVGAALKDRAELTRWVRSHGVPLAREETDGPDGPSPIIVHAFKGEVGLVELRGPGGTRHVTPDGVDLGDVRPAVTYDPTLRVPEELDSICRWSEVLSAHVSRPYVQLHWADRPARLQAVDVDPDRIPVLTREWDRRLGSVFDGAYARVLLRPFRSGGLANRVPGGTFSVDEEKA